MILTIDSSVWVASFLPQESGFQPSHDLIKKISDGEHEVILPAVVLVEVVSALVRRTGDESIVDGAINLILRLPNLEFVEVDYHSMIGAAKFAKETKLKGMDTIVVFVAAQYDATVVTFDREMKERAKLFVDILEI